MGEPPLAFCPEVQTNRRVSVARNLMEIHLATKLTFNEDHARTRTAVRPPVRDYWRKNGGPRKRPRACAARCVLKLKRVYFSLIYRGVLLYDTHSAGPDRIYQHLHARAV